MSWTNYKCDICGGKIYKNDIITGNYFMNDNVSICRNCIENKKGQ